MLDAAKHSPAAAGRFVRDGAVDLEPALVEHMLRREYPANVRDLVLVLRESMAASREETLVLPPSLAPSPRVESGPAARARAALERHAWNVTRSAASLGVSRDALIRLMKKHGLRAPG